MKEMFTCDFCQKSFPLGFDVETQFCLESGGAIVKCVYCYNQTTAHSLDIEVCAFHAYNLQTYGVALLPEHMGKTLSEIKKQSGVNSYFDLL